MVRIKSFGNLKAFQRAALLPGRTLKRTEWVLKIIIGWTKRLMYVLCRLIVLPTVGAFFFYGFLHESNATSMGGKRQYQER